MSKKALGQPCPERPDLDRLVKEAIARFAALSPDQQREHRRTHRISWVVGEMMLQHPDMTREQVAELYDGLVM